MAGGWVVGHSLLLVLPALIVLGPVVAVGIARFFENGWFLYNLAYSAGFVAAVHLFPDGQTLVGSGSNFTAYVSVLSLALGSMVGWWKHSD